MTVRTRGYWRLQPLSARRRRTNRAAVWPRRYNGWPWLPRLRCCRLQRSRSLHFRLDERLAPSQKYRGTVMQLRLQQSSQQKSPPPTRQPWSQQPSQQPPSRRPPHRQTISQPEPERLRKRRLLLPSARRPRARARGSPQSPRRWRACSCRAMRWFTHRASASATIVCATGVRCHSVRASAVARLAGSGTASAVRSSFAGTDW